MIVDPREVLFIRKNAPSGMLRTLSNNLNQDYLVVRQLFYRLLDEVDDDVIIEARRLLKANTGLEYSAEAEESKL